MKRQVYIELVGDAWRVLYAVRRKRQRYCAATFYAGDHSIADVKLWVRANDKLELVDAPRK